MCTGAGAGSGKGSQGSGEGLQSQVTFNKGSREDLAGFGAEPGQVQRRFQQALAQSQVRFKRVPERVPEKVPEKVGEFCGAKPGQLQQCSGRFRRRSGRLRCRAGSGSIGFRRKFR